MNWYKNVKTITKAAAALAIAAPLVMQFEGIRHTAYLDPVGIPTICYGHTATARMGQTYSQATCEKLLEGDLGHAMEVVDKYTAQPLPAETHAALASFVYNVGEGNFRTSTLLKRLNEGNLVAACDELRHWVYAKGRRLGGLVRRRAAEREVCLDGL